MEGGRRIVDETAEGIRRADGMDAFRFIRQTNHIGAYSLVGDDNGRIEVLGFLIFSSFQRLFCAFHQAGDAVFQNVLPAR